MLKAICISSANDAAVAVAEYVGGSETAFAEMMNVRAYELGMTNTHFVNACGLDEAGHLSTARDVALMSREMLLHHTEVRDYCSIWMDTLRGGEPLGLIEVDSLSADDVGELIYFYWRACAVSGYLLSVNPFDQPGVESYKKNMFALLGKPGYEDRKAELEAALKD